MYLVRAPGEQWAGMPLSLQMLKIGMENHEEGRAKEKQFFKIYCLESKT